MAEYALAISILKSSELVKMKNMKRHRSNKGACDRISHLPEPILRYIVSFLSTEDALRTSFLSKSWRNLWTCIPVLDFHESRFYHGKQIRYFYHGLIRGMGSRDVYNMRKQKKQFADLVDRSLLLHEGQNIPELKISFHYLDHYNLTIRADTWVRFAFANVHVVDLNFSGSDYKLDPCLPENLYQLPPCPYPSKLLKVLGLKFCLFNLSEHKSFPYLETMILTQVKLPDTSVQVLLANCPRLEFLHLKWCFLPHELVIYAPQSQLKHLWVESCISSPELEVLQYDINVPNLLHFQFVGRMLDGFSAMNLKKLIDASLEFKQDILFSTHGGMLCELLRDMDRARALTLSSWCLQVLPIVDDLDGLRESLPSPLSNLRHLTVQTGLDNFGLVGLACLLRSSPNLEAFSIDIGCSIRMKWDYIDEEDLGYLDIFDFDGENFWESQLLLFHCLTHRLKKVEINGFMGRNREIGLVKFLLQKSLILKEMVIAQVQDCLCKLKFLKLKLKIARKLISLPRASPYVEIKYS